MSTPRPPREYGSSTAPRRRHPPVPEPERVSRTLLRAALGSMFAASLVVALVTAVSRVAPPPAQAAPVSTAPISEPRDASAVVRIDAPVIVLAAAAGTPSSPQPLEGPASPTPPSRRVSPLVELALGARRRRRHLPLGAAVDAVVAIAAGAARVLVAMALCKVGCWCGTCAPSTADRFASTCECA